MLNSSELALHFRIVTLWELVGSYKCWIGTLERFETETNFR